ncbi:MAG: hypothetical protein LBQ32_06275 [Burkholderiaceae bacterium]|jgi:hypothetical protein|nr:hypothetical protein [Burkholderiaceae bacterium]
MASKQINGVDSAATPEEVRRLRAAVETMDSLSQEGFSEIAAIAKLALISLKTPEGYRHLDGIAYAIGAIRSKAQDVENCINSEAEGVGCNYVKGDEHRRWDARRAARAQGIPV